jgi:hypothetical protein
MVVALMAAQAAIGLDQLDAIAFHRIHCADMDAIGADDFGVLFNQAQIGHNSILPLLSIRFKRAKPVFVPPAHKSR